MKRKQQCVWDLCPLHQGHIDLIQRAKLSVIWVVVSGYEETEESRSRLSLQNISLYIREIRDDELTSVLPSWMRPTFPITLWAGRVVGPAEISHDETQQELIDTSELAKRGFGTVLTEKGFESQRL